MKCPQFRKMEEWQSAECQKHVKVLEDRIAKKTNVRLLRASSHWWCAS